MYAWFASIVMIGALSSPIAMSPPLPEDEIGLARQALALATNGDGFLAVWSERRGKNTVLVASRISAAGEVLDPAGIIVESFPVTEAKAVWTGEAWAIVWCDGHYVYGRRMTADGTLLDTEPRAITPHLTPLYGPRAELSVVAAGARLIFAVSDDRYHLYATDLELGNPHELQTAGELRGNTRIYSIAGDGTDVFVITPVVSSRFGSLLRYFTLGESGLDLVRPSAIDTVHTAYSRGRYWSVWSESDGQWIATFDRNGVRLTEPVRVASTIAPKAIIPFDDRILMIGANALVAVEVNGATSALPGDFGMSGVYAAENASHRTLALWNDRTGRIVTGSVPGGETHVVARTPWPQDSLIGDPSGRSPFVAWSERGRIFARDLLDGGAAQPLSSNVATSAAALAGGNRSTLFAFKSAGVIEAVLLRDDVAPAKLTFGSSGTAKDPAAVLENNGIYSVFWSDRSRLSTSRITNDGVLLDPQPAVIAEANGNPITSVTAVHGDEQSLLVWQQQSPCVISGMRLDRYGNALEKPVFLTNCLDGKIAPAATWDGAAFRVVWIYGAARITPSGEVTELPLLVGANASLAGSATLFTSSDYRGVHTVITNAGEESKLDLPATSGLLPRLVPMPRGAIALLYTDARASEGYIPRVFARFVTAPSRSRAATAP